jgi:hypothetical protein
LYRLAKGDLAVVQSITGHRTLSELQKYLHIMADRQRVTADAYSAGDGGTGATTGGPHPLITSG